jgi:murein DD-endopeptidase MepM/ murein hydrolase activator NlpD
MATGNGTVTSVGKRNGYGRTILIRHGGKYETLYAHLNGYAKGVKFGSRVNQGDIIGYVGSSGLATGPHLHYEFRIHGIHKNPATVTFPKSDPIAKKYLSAFSRVAAIWASELDNLERISLAQNQAVQ